MFFTAFVAKTWESEHFNSGAVSNSICSLAVEQAWVVAKTWVVGSEHRWALISRDTLMQRCNVFTGMISWVVRSIQVDMFGM